MRFGLRNVSVVALAAFSLAGCGIKGLRSEDFPTERLRLPEPFGADYSDYTATSAGTFDIDADWPSGGPVADENDASIAIYVTTTSCNTTSYVDVIGGFSGCPTLASSNSGRLPRHLSYDAGVGTYRVYVVGSFLAADEAVALDVTLSH